MNKSKLLVISSIITLLSFQSYQNKNRLPENPKAGQEYKDDRGNTWSWNPLGYWMIMNSMGSSSRYYPSTNTWTNSSGIASKAPSNVSSDMTNSLNNKFTGKSYKSNSSSKSKSINTTKSSSRPRSGGFGRSSKSSIS